MKFRKEIIKEVKDVLLLYCGFYTVVTLLNSVSYLLDGVYEDPTGNWHEIHRGVIVLIVVLAIVLEKHIKMNNIILKEVLIYVPMMLLVFGYVWLDGLREPLSDGAYWGIFKGFTSAWICYSIVVILYRLIKKRLGFGKVENPG